MEIINFLNMNPNIFLMIMAGLGLIVGSFLNVVIHRLPRMIQNEWSDECREYLGLKNLPSDNESLNLYLPQSHCTHCKKTLKPWHNIPVISYLVLRGKCAYCQFPISLRYPFVEFLCCVASTYVAWHFGVSWQTVGALLFTWIMISAAFIDLDYHLLPDHLTYLLLWAGLLLSI